MIRSLQLGQHLIALVLTVVGAARALAGGAAPAGVLAAAIGFVCWYAAGLVMARDARPARWWLLGLALVWVLAVVVSAEFVWLAFPLWLLAGHLLRLGWAAGFSMVVFTVVVVAPVLHTGTASYSGIIGPLVGGIFAIGISRGYLELQREARERERLVDSLVQAQAEMAELHEELARSQHESGMIAERTRLSRDIHDTIAQGFSSIGLLARAAIDGGAEPAAARTFTQIDGLVKENLVDVRRVVAALAPAELEEGALTGALRRMLVRLAAETGITTEMHVDDGFPALPTAVEVALLRTAQSSLANVRLHSGATRVVVTLADAGNSVRLDVVDDGRGFDVAAWDAAGAAGSSSALSSYGLHSMRARLRELGGGLDVESATGDGAALSAHVPLRLSTAAG